MVTYASSNVVFEFDEFQDAEQMEKIIFRHNHPMLTRRSSNAKRAMHRTPASRRASRRVAAQIGGKDRRRLRYPSH